MPHRFARLCALRVGVVAVALVSASAQAQSRKHIDYFSVGVFGGVAHYAGDLSPNPNLLFPQDPLAAAATFGPAVGVFGSYHWHPHMSVRVYLGYGQISANDADSKSERNRQRNLSFGSNLFEAGVQLHYDYFGNDRDYRYRARLTPFVFGGIGVVYYDPYAYRDPATKSDKTFLRELRTEAQETPYSPVAVVIPFGGGLRYRLSDTWDLRLEIGLRWTATDYLDDVSGATPGANQGYPTPAQLAGSPDRAFFSYRAQTPSPDYSLRRGNPDKTDWYAFTGISIAKIIDELDPCPKPQRRGRLRE